MESDITHNLPDVYETEQVPIMHIICIKCILYTYIVYTLYI